MNFIKVKYLHQHSMTFSMFYGFVVYYLNYFYDLFYLDLINYH
jgi:hypothetical protein